MKTEKEYKPISCTLHDHFESAAVKGELVNFEILLYDGMIKIFSGIIVDIFIRDKAEFLKLKSGDEIRLDKIISMNGITNTIC